MTKMIKNLMLVAVAAMAFVGCQQDIEINAELNKTSVRVIAGFDDTRSGFGEKVDGAYKQIWNGGEKLSYYHYSYSVYSSNNGTVTLPEGESSNAIFDIQLTGVGNAAATEGVIRIASPAASVTANNGYFAVNVPTEQTPLANSVDPLAHILTYTHYYYDGVPDVIDARFEHAVAYGKMTLNNLPEGNYDYVTISLDSKTYKLYTTNVQDNAFWFGCEAVKPAEVKVSVVDETANVAYTKTLDLTKAPNFQFVKGRLGVFSVEMAGVEASTPEGEEYIELATLTNKETYNSTKEGYQWAYASDDNSFRGDIYINNGKSTSELIDGTYTWHSLYASQNTPGFTCTFRNNGLQSVTSASLVVEGNDVYLTINGYKFKYTFADSGNEEPSQPTQLAMPTGLAATATVDTATITWEAVTYASSYDVTVGTTTKNVTALTATFEGLTAETTYDVSVVAVGDGTTYTNSSAATTTVTTEADTNNVGGQTDPWEFRLTDVDYASGAYKVTLTGTNGYVMIINGLKLGSSINVSSVTLNNVETAVSGTAAINFGGVYPVVINLTITSTGVKYTGTSINGMSDYM